MCYDVVRKRERERERERENERERERERENVNLSIYFQGCSRTNKKKSSIMIKGLFHVAKLRIINKIE